MGGQIGQVHHGCSCSQVTQEMLLFSHHVPGWRTSMAKAARDTLSKKLSECTTTCKDCVSGESSIVYMLDGSEESGIRVRWVGPGWAGKPSFANCNQRLQGTNHRIVKIMFGNGRLPLGMGARNVFFWIGLQALWKIRKLNYTGGSCLGHQAVTHVHNPKLNLQAPEMCFM